MVNRVFTAPVFPLRSTIHDPRSTRLIAGLAAFIFALTPLAADAGGLIRDAEIEHTLRAYADPIFTAAGIPPEDVRVLIVDDPSINAYVAGGLNMFIHTGIILAADKPGMLIGVMAHETGHIAGAHLSQMGEKSTRAMLGGAIGALIGVAAIAAGGSNGAAAGGGIIMGSQSMAQRQFMGDIRQNETSADQAGLRFLDSLDISGSGMLEMFEKLRLDEQSHNTQTDPFLRDHPLTSDRIGVMRDHVNESSVPKDQVPAAFVMMHARMRAKLIGFTKPYSEVLADYPLTDASVPARYARAIADFKRGKLADALNGMNRLIAEQPQDAFFYDTKGQMLFENGRLKDAADAYASAARYAPRNALILTDEAGCFTAQENPALLPRAVALLEQSKEIDDSYDVTWRELAIAYGRQGRMGLSYMALAEEASLSGDYKTVLQHVARARTYQSDDPSLGLKLDDLEHDAKAQLKAKKDQDLF